MLYQPVSTQHRSKRRGVALAGALLSLFLLVFPLPRVAGAVGASESAYQDLLLALSSGAHPDASLAEFLAVQPTSIWQLRGRIVAAEAAYRLGDEALVRKLLPAASLGEHGFLTAYGSYMLGLLSTDASHEHFTRAFELAGNTLLRHRAALWLAEELRLAGDVAGAQLLLASLPAESLDHSLRADLVIRSSLLLDQLGQGEQAFALTSDLYLGFPLLAADRETRPLYDLVRSRVAPRAAELSARARADRVLALCDAGRASLAIREARSLEGADDLSDDEASYVVARAELESGNPRNALAQIEKISRQSPRHDDGRLLEGRALIKLGQRTRGEQRLEKLALDLAASDARYEAAERLEKRFDKRDDPRVWRMRQVLSDGPHGDPADNATWQLGWRAYREGKNDHAARLFGQLVARTAEPVNVSRGTYWGARTLERLGRDDDARVLYGEAFRSEPRGYYGLASARHIRRSKPDHDPYAVGLNGIDGTPPDPFLTAPESLIEALGSARELLMLGLFDDAVAEIKYQSRRFPDEAAPHVLLAEAYHAQDDYMKSVRWLKRAFPDFSRTGLPEAYWTRLYPLSHWDDLKEIAAQQGLDPYFVAAVTYRESRFQSGVRSRAGALGLMQIMPGTGKMIARNLRERGFTTAGLYEPRRNMRYGMHYLRQLLDDNDGNPVYALAGYNAGPGRVRRWAKNGYDALDEFIEGIPFRETRLYVKKILVAHDAYHRVYDRDHSCDLSF